MLQVQFVTFEKNRGQYVCQVCEDDNAAVTFRMTHPDLSRLRIHAEFVMTAMLDFADAPGPSARVSHRENLLRLGQLCDRVRNHLNGTPEQPQESVQLLPFLTPREFSQYVAGLQGQVATVKLIHGYTVTGRLSNVSGAGVLIEDEHTGERSIVDSDEVCDIYSFAAVASLC